MKFSLSPQHWLMLPASQRTLHPPQGCFWEATLPSEVRDLWEAFVGKPYKEVPLRKNGEIVGMKRYRNDKVIIARIWAKDLFFTMAAILKVPESHVIHSFKTNRYIHLGHKSMTAEDVKEAWSKAIQVSKKNFDPAKALQSYYDSRRYERSNEPLSTSLDKMYKVNHAASIRASAKRVDDATDEAN